MDEFIAVHQNERAGLPLDQEMREDHRFARASRHTHDLAPDPAQGRGLDRSQRIALIGAERDLHCRGGGGRGHADTCCAAWPVGAQSRRLGTLPLLSPYHGGCPVGDTAQARCAPCRGSGVRRGISPAVCSWIACRRVAGSTPLGAYVLSGPSWPWRVTPSLTN